MSEPMSGKPRAQAKRRAAAQTKQDWADLNHRVSTVFTPAVPVSESDLFAGRTDQLNKVIDAANQRGQHAIVYGERGVGKTSLASVLSSRIRTVEGVDVMAPMVNCHSGQTYAGVWREAFGMISLSERKDVPGFASEPEHVPAPGLLPDDDDQITPGAVCTALATVASLQQDQGIPTLIIMDEFDRTPNGLLKRMIADTIKTLSDRAVPVTIVIVGVADTVGDLIAEHQSIERAITQVHMPRMETSEMHEILRNGTERLGMKICSGARTRIANLSQGLPSYTHRLSLESAREAIRARRRLISEDDVGKAVERVVRDTGQSLRDTYRRAISSTRSENLFEQVMLSCASAETDQFGYFAASDVRRPMTTLMGKEYDIPSFATHLKQFCEAPRGEILRRAGAARRYRYRFNNPLMQPFVIMNGIVAEYLDEDAAIIPGAGMRHPALPYG